MKIRDYLIHLLGNIYDNKITFVMNTVLITISLCIIAVTSHEYYKQQIVVDNIKSLGINDDVGIIKNKTFNYMEDEKFGEKLNSFIRDLRKEQGIDFVEYYYNDGFMSEEFWNNERLLEINIMEAESKGVSSNFSDHITYGSFSTVACNGELLSALNVKLQSGSLEDFKRNSDYIPVIGGSCYTDILEIGKEIISITGEKYKVVAFLEPDSNFLAKDAIGDKYGIVKLDYKIIVPTEMIDNSMFAATYMNSILVKTQDMEQAKTAANNIAEKYGIGAQLITLDEWYEEYYELHNKELRKWGLLLLTVVIMGFLSMSVSLTVGILTNRKKYGIYIVSGIKINTISKLFLFENLLKLILGNAVACLYMLRQIRNLSVIYSDSYILMLENNFWAHTFPVMLLVSIVILLIITVIPVICLRNLKPVKILREAI